MWFPGMPPCSGRKSPLFPLLACPLCECAASHSFPKFADFGSAGVVSAGVIASCKVAVTKSKKPAVASLAASPRLKHLLSPDVLGFESSDSHSARVALLISLASHPSALIETIAAVAGGGAEGYVVQANVFQLIANLESYIGKEWLTQVCCLRTVRPFVSYA